MSIQCRSQLFHILLWKITKKENKLDVDWPPINCYLHAKLEIDVFCRFKEKSHAACEPNVTSRSLWAQCDVTQPVSPMWRHAACEPNVTSRSLWAMLGNYIQNTAYTSQSVCKLNRIQCIICFSVNENSSVSSTNKLANENVTMNRKYVHYHQTISFRIKSGKTAWYIETLKNQSSSLQSHKTACW